MKPFSAVKSVVKALRPSTRRRYQNAYLQSIIDEQDEINRRGHA
jgi:hypothetical protein